MRSLDQEFLDRQSIPRGLLRTVRALGEYKGKQDLFKQQAPQILESLRQAAIIESTESSNRIEGVTAPHDRINAITEKRPDGSEVVRFTPVPAHQTPQAMDDQVRKVRQGRDLGENVIMSH